MKLLAIETGTLTASVAIVDGAAAVTTQERSVATHSDVLLVLIDRALADAGLTVADLDGVAIGAGPGSFTGLRIGMATAKGLCFARDLPLWTVSSLAALAYEAGTQPDRDIVAIIDAKKNEVYVGAFRIDSPTAPPRALCPERCMPPAQVASFIADLENPAILGTGALAYPDVIAPLGELLTGARATPSALAVARIAQTANEAAVLATAVPTYIRLSDAELKWSPTGASSGGSSSDG